MKVATFNINGIKARSKALGDWLDESKSDIVLLQETKSIDEAFPKEPFLSSGYNVATHGQKSFNGVAIMSKLPFENLSVGLPGDDTDDQARWIEATVIGKQPIRICGLYLPNGNPVPGPKYQYKLEWMERLYKRAKDLIASEIPVLMAGDYNIIPQREDAATPENWTNDALFLPQSREAFRKIIGLGFTEAFRTYQPAGGHYSFWDYQAGAWHRNNGIRIDHILMSPPCADLMLECHIDKYVRDCEKPSDHVPVWVRLNN